MKISYDYEEMIQELKEDVNDGVLLLTNTIQILRSDKEIDHGYRPIIDWYYDASSVAEYLQLDIFDDEQDRQEKREFYGQYEKDKPSLTNILVENCLLEMQARNKII